LVYFCRATVKSLTSLASFKRVIKDVNFSEYLVLMCTRVLFDAAVGIYVVPFCPVHMFYCIVLLGVAMIFAPGDLLIRVVYFHNLYSPITR